MRPYARLILVLVTVFAACVGLALLLSLGILGGISHQQQWVEALLQAGLIAVLGVVTTFVVEGFKDITQRRRDLSQLRFDVLKEVSRAYFRVKLLRRQFKNTGTLDLDKLNKLQIVFESHSKHSVELFEHNTQLQTSLTNMEKYLEKVADKKNEVERLRFKDKEPFRAGLARDYRNAVAAMRHVIGVRKPEKSGSPVEPKPPS